MKISITIDTEPDYKSGKYSLMQSGLKDAEKLFDKYGIKPTLFVTCDCIEKYPKLFQYYKKKGWEIALHGYRHLRFDEMNREEKEKQLDLAISCFKKYLKIKPAGLRAPQFSSEFELIELAEKKGFIYDSSKVQFPLFQLIFFRRKFKLYAKQISFKRKIEKMGMKIKEIPVSSTVLPVSMFTLRKLPFFIFRMLVWKSAFLRNDDSLVFLSHSYEYNQENMKKLERFITKNKKNEFMTMKELAR